MRSRNDAKKYAATSRLPGIKPLLGHFETMEESKSMGEKAPLFWMRELAPNVELRGDEVGRPNGGASG